MTMTIPKVSDSDIREAFRPQPKFVRTFRELWLRQLGEILETPTDSQLRTWLTMAGYDLEIIRECVGDLQSRAKSSPPLNPADPYEHGLRHFSAALIRLTRAKYGRVRPTWREAA